MALVHIVLFIVTFTFYLLTLFVLSEEYTRFVMRKRLDEWSIVMLAVFIVFIVILAVLIWFSFQASILLLTPLFFFILLPIFVKKLNIVKLLKRSTPTEHTLDEKRVEVYVYTNSYVGAFYYPRDRRIYVHRGLLNVLSHDELNAVLWHEWRHGEQGNQLIFSLLRLLASLATSFWILGGLVLSIMVGFLFYMLLINLIMGKLTSELLTWLLFIASLHLIASVSSLVLTYARWIWEHDADFYASKKVGTETFARALVKVYFVGYLHEKMKYAELENLSVSVCLDSIPPLTFLGVLEELLLQTLLARGFIDIVAKPLVETHPPLHLRLRAVRTAI